MKTNGTHFCQVTSDFQGTYLFLIMMFTSLRIAYLVESQSVAKENHWDKCSVKRDWPQE